MLSKKASKFKLTMKLVSIFAVLTAIAIFGGTDAGAGAIKMKFSHQNNVYDADQLLAETFKKSVEEQTKGEIKVTIYPGTLTTSEEEAIEFAKSGSLDIDTISAGHIAGYYKDVQFLQLPYLFKSPAHYYIARQSGVVKQILKELEKATGLIPLGIYSDCNGFGVASTKPINSFADTKGVKLRCMQNPLFIDIYSAFGFTVTPTDWGELYTSLQTGLVNAHDLGCYCNYIFKLREVTNSFAVLRQMWTQKILFISPKTWKKLSDSQREIVKTVANEAIELTDAWQYTREALYIEKAKKEGITVTYPDTAPFKKAAEKVYAKWFKENPHWKAWYDAIQYLDPGTRLPEAYKNKKD
ncbi:TRAP transporter substrate-binding protein [Desulfococcaceae bacterium HSG7]|nr:TRAP transporter substrate-binding protein [Desulfococcaceae bacterium HSG7]